MAVIILPDDKLTPPSRPLRVDWESDRIGTRAPSWFWWAGDPNQVHTNPYTNAQAVKPITVHQGVWSTGVMGPERSYDSTASQYTDLNVRTPATSAISIGIIFRSTASDGIILASRTSSSTAGFDFVTGASSTPGDVVFRAYRTSSSQTPAAVGASNQGILRHYIGRWATTHNSGYPVLYVDGAKVGDGGTAIVSSITPTQDWYIARRGTTYTTGCVVMAYAFDSRISDYAIQEFTADPWGFFKRDVRRVYFLPSAGGGGATITADSGTFALSGTAVDLKANRKLSAESGTFALTGSDVALRFNRRLAADSGTFTFNGSDVAFARGLSLAAESGSYTLSGTDVSLKAGRKLAAESGTYSISGSDVTLTYSPAGAYTLTAESGGFTLTGSDAALRVNRKLAAESGTFSLTGSDVGLARAYTLDTESGTYVLTGSDVAFARTYRLVSESGSYVLAGSDVSLVWSGQPVDVTHVTGGGGSRPSKRMLVSERKVREEVDEYLRKKSDAALLRQIQREDDEFVLIMAALAA